MKCFLTFKFQYGLVIGSALKTEIIYILKAPPDYCFFRWVNYTSSNLFHCNFVDTLQILHWCSWGWNFRVTPAQNVHVYLWRSASALLSSGPSPLSQLHWLCNQIPLPLSAFSISLVVSYYKTSRLQNPPCNISSGLQQLAWACWRQSATWNWTFSESHRLTHSFCWAAEGCTRLK